VRPPFKYHGGKSYLAPKLIPLLPRHRVYVEPFAGGLNVLLNKPRASVEVAGDLDADLIRFYRVLCGRPGELLGRVRTLEYRADTFEWARCADDVADSLDAAIRFLVRQRFSRGSLGRSFAWSERQRGGRPGDLNAWETIKGQLPRIAGRLRGVLLRCRRAIDVIREFDGPDTLFYLDPPYPHDTRTVTAAYGHEMTLADHVALVATITRLRGKVAISSYPNPMYDRALSGWDRHEFDMPNHSGQGCTKKRRVEVLWIK
jgi:DNA adenine methylase